MPLDTPPAGSQRPRAVSVTFSFVAPMARFGE